jgi:uncharacterized protein with GYD domain
MPTFITQGRFTREYLRGGLAKPEDRQVMMSKLCEAVGGRFLSMYFTLGQYDFLVLSDMPDARAAASIALVASAAGGIADVVTTQAFTSAEGKELFERAGKVTGQYKPMGG